MAKAMWKGTVLAESERYELVEGNVYFPAEALRSAQLRPSGTHTTCPWKGVASYYDVVVDGEVNKDAARNIRGHVAFWKGVQVER